MHTLHFDITLLPTDSLHHDIVIELGDWRATGDTYWLAQRADSWRGDLHAARKLLIQAIEHWIRLIKTSSARELWLPLLVSDQCALWLSVARQEGNVVVLSTCSSAVEGHEVDKALSPVDQVPQGCTIESPQFTVSMQVFIACLQQVRARL